MGDEASDGGLWDYDDDLPTPPEPSKEESDDVIIDSQEEAGRRRGRPSRPGGGCSVPESKKQQGRPSKRKRVEMLAIIDDDDEDGVPSLAKQKRQAQEQHKAACSKADPSNQAGDQGQTAPSNTKPPAPPQLFVSSQTRALLERANLCKQQLQGTEDKGEEEEEEEDQASTLKGSNWQQQQQQQSTAQHDSGDSADTGVMHMPQLAALSARARAAEALQKVQEQEQQRLQEQQQQQRQQQQQQEDAEQLQGILGATQCAEDAIIIKCQYKGGEFLKLRCPRSKKVCEVLKKFRDLLCERGKGASLPQDDSAFRLEFDGDKLDLETTLEHAGIENEDSLDVTWK